MILSDLIDEKRKKHVKKFSEEFHNFYYEQLAEYLDTGNKEDSVEMLKYRLSLSITRAAVSQLNTDAGDDNTDFFMNTLIRFLLTIVDVRFQNAKKENLYLFKSKLVDQLGKANSYLIEFCDALYLKYSKAGE